MKVPGQYIHFRKKDFKRKEKKVKLLYFILATLKTNQIALHRMSVKTYHISKAIYFIFVFFFLMMISFHSLFTPSRTLKALMR